MRAALRALCRTASTHAQRRELNSNNGTTRFAAVSAFAVPIRSPLRPRAFLPSGQTPRTQDPEGMPRGPSWGNDLISLSLNQQQMGAQVTYDAR